MRARARVIYRFLKWYEKLNCHKISDYDISHGPCGFRISVALVQTIPCPFYAEQLNRSP